MSDSSSGTGKALAAIMALAAVLGVVIAAAAYLWPRGPEAPGVPDVTGTATLSEPEVSATTPETPPEAAETAAPSSTPTQPRASATSRAETVSLNGFEFEYEEQGSAPGRQAGPSLFATSGSDNVAAVFINWIALRDDVVEDYSEDCQIRVDVSSAGGQLVHRDRTSYCSGSTVERFPTGEYTVLVVDELSGINSESGFAVIRGE